MSFVVENNEVPPDLLLIYRKPEPWTLQLAGLGSHSELAS
jgi:mRNA interferase YafQ